MREPATGTQLATFCAETSVERSTVVAFSTPAGAKVEEEVLVEGRTEKYFGSAPPEREDAFWCSAVPELYLRPVEPWTCLRTAGDDPPATILAVEPRGEIAPNGASSGYALQLDVRHPGVLHVLFDEDCLRDRFQITTDGGASADGGAPMPWGELTIQ